MKRRGCIYCLQMVKVINKVNLRLSIEKKIRIIDCSDSHEFGLNNIPLMKKLHNDGFKDGYPFLFIDGLVIEPFATVEQGLHFFKEFLNDDFEEFLNKGLNI